MADEQNAAPEEAVQSEEVETGDPSSDPQEQADSPPAATADEQTVDGEQAPDKVETSPTEEEPGDGPAQTENDAAAEATQSQEENDATPPQAPDTSEGKLEGEDKEHVEAPVQADAEGETAQLQPEGDTSETLPEQNITEEQTQQDREGTVTQVEKGTEEQTQETTEEATEEGMGQPKAETEEGAGTPQAGENGEVVEHPPGEDGDQKEAAVVEGEAEQGEGDGAPGEDGQEKEVTEGERQSPIPQSDTFAEGEGPEEVLAVGERLSREGTPEIDRALEDRRGDSPPVPGSPNQNSERDEEEEEEGEEEEEEYDIEEEAPQFDRELLIEKYHQALAEREQMHQQNHQLQHKLADYFRKKKSDEQRQDVDKNVTDQEQRYLKYMANLEELRRQYAEEQDAYKLQIGELEERCQEKQGVVGEERLAFLEFKKQVALDSVNSRSGRAIPPKDIEQYLLNENRKESEVANVRLENIKLKNKLKKKEYQLKSKEELAEGLHLIDFEQLKIENQTYNEKIEERNEELLKLRKKITSTVQVLTHLKEKLQFVQAENGVLKSKLRDVEDTVAKKRDILSRTKQARDALRIDNTKLRQNCGLLGNEPLLRDFEDRKDESETLREKLEQLKMQHAELTLTCTGVRRKIEQARLGQT